MKVEQIEKRIRAAYLAAIAYEGRASLSPIWAHIVSKNEAFYRDLESGDYVTNRLNNPASTYLFYGFDNLHVETTIELMRDSGQRSALTAATFRVLVLLAESVGAKRVWNPELTAAFSDRERPLDDIGTTEAILSSIDEEIGYKIDFPNPFPDEFGLVTSRGIASHRALFAIYQAWRLKRLSRQYGGKVLEIGAGLGRTAYYARRMGIESYTIVDIPQTNVSQANFLLRVLEEDQITLTGEPEYYGQVRIYTPEWLRQPYEKFDIVLNCDSLTEMDLEVSTGYAREFVKRGKVLLSINHEANTDTVHSLAPLKGRCFGRFPYAMRPGYLEEMFYGR